MGRPRNGSRVEQHLAAAHTTDGCPCPCPDWAARIEPARRSPRAGRCPSLRLPCLPADGAPRARLLHYFPEGRPIPGLARVPARPRQNSLRFLVVFLGKLIDERAWAAIPRHGELIA